MSTARRTRRLRVVLVAGGLLIGIAGGEVALRLVDYQGIGAMKKDPVLGHRYRPGFDAVRFDQEAQRPVRVTINALGFRDRERYVDGAGARRVAVLGDSFVAGFGVDFERNLSQVAEAELRRVTDDPWEVMNFGVAGYGTAQSMLAYEEVARELAPEAVVLAFFAGNDVSDNSSELSTNPRIYYHVEDGQLVCEPRSAVRRGLSAFLNEHSRLYVWQKRQTKVLAQLVKTKMVVNPVHRVFLATEDPRVERAWATTLALIARLRLQVEADGARFAVVYIPFSDEVNPDWWAATIAESKPLQREQWDLDGPERRLREFCADEGVDFISPKAALAAALAQSGARFYFEHGHFNERGHEVVGRRIAEWLLAN